MHFPNLSLTILTAASKRYALVRVCLVSYQGSDRPSLCVPLPYAVQYGSTALTDLCTVQMWKS